jgi:hypothetical protein
MFNAGRGRLYAAPEGLEDVLNTAGKEPKRQTGYGKDPVNGAGSGGKGTGSARNRYRDDLEEAWKKGSEAASQTATKIQNVFRYAID